MAIIKLFLRKHIRGSLLDVGCGRGSDAYLLCRDRVNHSVGCDIFLKRLEEAKQHHDEVVLCDARFLPFQPKKFDVILASEILEHLKPMEALSVLEELEKLPKEKIIITVPTFLGEALGIKARSSKERSLDGDEWLHHRCRIPVSYLKQRRYKVRGRRGALWGGKFYHFRRWNPIIKLWKILSFFLPNLSEGIIAVKLVKE